VELNLQDLINAAQSASEGQSPVEAVAAVLAHADNAGADVAGLLEQAISEFNSLHTEGENTPERATALEALADVADAVRGEVSRRDSDAAARDEALAALAARVNADAPAEGEGDGGAEADAAAGAEVVAEAEAVTEAAVTEAVTEGAPAEAVVAAAAPRPRVDLSRLPRRAPAVVQSDATPGVQITASADVPGFQVGQALTMDSLVAAANARISRFPLGVEGISTRAQIARIKTEFPKELVASADAVDQQVLDYAGSQHRLEGGSLVAAGGWCSPSETLYDLAGELEDGSAGLIDVPDISVPRGGIRTTEGPDFATLYSAVGFMQTETQAIAGTEKTFYRVPCTNFDDTRADVMGVGIVSGILNDDAYPELTERVVRGSLVVHNHKYNYETIKRMEAQSTAVTVNVGPSATTSLLNSIELQIIDYRYSYRASDNLLLEVVLPTWVKGAVRSDLALRSGVHLQQVSDAQITAWFAERGARVQWVYDWQDAFANAGTGFGGATAITAWPDSVKALVYAAGAFVRGRGEVISLDGIYDSTNIKVNDFVRLFTEEKILVKRRQYKSRVLTIALAVNGATSAPRELDGDGVIVVGP
jgi:hypothetical protein